MWKKILLTLVGVGAVFGAIIAVKARQFAPPPPFAFPPVVVTTATAESQTWERLVPAIGSVRAARGVTLAPEVSGTVASIRFESGADVAEGDILLELDSSVESARLRAAEAAAELAALNVARSRELRARDTIAQADLDAAEAAVREAVAQVDNLRAEVARRVIRAPFAGRLGIRQVDLGQVLSPGSPVVTLQSLAKVYVDFSLPQQRLGEVAVGHPVRIETRGLEGVSTGTVEAIDPEVDVATRTFRVRASFANPGEHLRPGMFVSVQVVRPEPLPVVAVPATAVYSQSYGDVIFAVRSGEGGSLSAEQRAVRLGERRGDFVQVVSGVQAGETIVTSGVFRLGEGTPLAVDNTLAPRVSLTPTPADT